MPVEDWERWRWLCGCFTCRTLNHSSAQIWAQGVPGHLYPGLTLLCVAANRTQGKVFLKIAVQSFSVAQSGLELTYVAQTGLELTSVLFISAGVIGTSHQAQQNLLCLFLFFCFWYWELNTGPNSSKVSTLPQLILGLIAACF